MNWYKVLLKDESELQKLKNVCYEFIDRDHFGVINVLLIKPDYSVAFISTDNDDLVTATKMLLQEDIVVLTDEPTLDPSDIRILIAESESQ